MIFAFLSAVFFDAPVESSSFSILMLGSLGAGAMDVCTGRRGMVEFIVLERNRNRAPPKWCQVLTLSSIPSWIILFPSDDIL